MGTFGEDALALSEEVVEEVLGVGELEGAQEGDSGEEVGFEGFDFQSLMMVGSDGGVLGDGFSVALLEIREQDVADAQADAADFVGVGGADAFESAANFGVAAGFFADAVERAVRGQDELGLLGDVEVFDPIHPPIGQLLEFLAEDDGVEDDAVADDVQDMGVENAAGHLVQDVLNAVEGEGVTGVGAALETGDGIVGGCEDVYDFAFAFIAPLEAY